MEELWDINGMPVSIGGLMIGFDNGYLSVYKVAALIYDGKRWWFRATFAGNETGLDSFSAGTFKIKEWRVITDEEYEWALQATNEEMNDFLDERF